MRSVALGLLAALVLASSLPTAATRGPSNTAFTASLDAVSVVVEWHLPPAAPSYDDNGALLNEGTYGSRAFTYDALGRLTGVTGPGLSASYTLDGEGNRVAALVNGATTSFDLDRRGLPTVLVADGRKYLPGMPEAGYDDGATWWNGLTTAQGSVLGHVDLAGNQTPLTHYDPYGGLLPGSPPAGTFGYSGEWSDATGLLNLRARAYDPAFGRFLNRDAFGGFVGLPSTGNRYAYALGNPLRYTDPSGHFVGALFRDARLVASIGLQMIPGIGDAYSVLTGAIGHDPIAGISLTSEGARARRARRGSGKEWQ